MSLRLSEEEYAGLYYRVHKELPPEARQHKPAKKHKYNAKKVEIDGHVFPSKLEGSVYTELRWQYAADLITEPLLQVRFSLGVHYGKERFYVADFVFIENGALVVADAKGHETDEYKQKRKEFHRIYGLTIREYRKYR